MSKSRPKDHIVHTYCCISCPKTYKSKHNLKRHVDHAHYCTKVFECRICRKTFSSN